MEFNYQRCCRLLANHTSQLVFKTIHGRGDRCSLPLVLSELFLILCFQESLKQITQLFRDAKVGKLFILVNRQ